MADAIRNQYTPDDVSPPGETLADVLEDRGLTQAALARRTGLSQKTICGIVAGREPITQATALRLERVLGVPARFWNNRESAYRECLARKEEERGHAGYAEWSRLFPYPDGVRLGFLEETRSPSKRVRSLCSFFGVSSPEAYDRLRAELVPVWRAERTASGNVHARAMWMRMCEIRAAEVDCEPYDETAFRAALHDVRALTRVPAAEAMSRLRSLCAKCGVAVVLVPEVKGTAAYGATRWLGTGRAMIALSTRRKTEDHLWFAFYHEAGHILLHGRRRVFLEVQTSAGPGGDDERREREADRFAADRLVPPGPYARLVRSGSFSSSAIQRFAREIGIAPGVVVGRLQHDRHVPYERYSNLKVPCRLDG